LVPGFFQGRGSRAHAAPALVLASTLADTKDHREDRAESLRAIVGCGLLDAYSAEMVVLGSQLDARE
jgi:hypothetical protein